jgi:hypothetical protein
VLERTKLEADERSITLRVAAGEEALIGDAVMRRLERLAEALERKPQTGRM